ncbi:hypothetical protein B296_00047202 [Ensete ventricosum]|uniref:Uncharacterized protein n=1 Tax=Ensete ventricosum TaxID=4639 RepID=A0A426YLE1_ENSVE|nr:hypothetical protein B296_00047202 [Ensete ventricosum]
MTSRSRAESLVSLHQKTAPDISPPPRHLPAGKRRADLVAVFDLSFASSPLCTELWDLVSTPSRSVDPP